MVLFCLSLFFFFEISVKFENKFEVIENFEQCFSVSLQRKNKFDRKPVRLACRQKITNSFRSRGFYDEADFTFSNILSIKLKEILLRMGMWSRNEIFRANEREQTSFLHAWIACKFQNKKKLSKYRGSSFLKKVLLLFYNIQHLYLKQKLLHKSEVQNDHLFVSQIDGGFK